MIEAGDATTLVDFLEGGGHVVLTVGGEMGLDDLEGLAEGSDLEHVHGSTDTEVGKVDLFLGGGRARDSSRGNSNSHLRIDIRVGVGRE